jgi:DNA-binding response OmpR family regulator
MSPLLGGSVPEPATARSLPTASNDAGSSPNAPKALVVDDDSGARSLMAKILVRRGYRVRETDSGVGALMVAAETRLDFVALDLKLPHLSGLAALRIWHATQLSARVVIVSGYFSEEIREEVSALGTATMIDKPFKLETFAGGLDAVPKAGRAGLPKAPARGSLKRWVELSLRGLGIDADMRTIDDWAHYVGTSRTTLKAICALTGVSTRASSRLVRLLNATIRALYHGVSLGEVLDVSDGRTLGHLLQAAGLNEREPALSIPLLLARQRLLPPGSAHIRELSQVFREPPWMAR